MKNYQLLLFTMVCSILLFACSSTSGTASRQKNLKDYSQYNTLAEVLQSVQGLNVTGNGSNAKVYMSGYNTTNATNREPLFVVDGIPIGSSLLNLNGLLTPVMVKSVKTVRGMQATSRYGDEGLYGVVEITTINNK
ncbi:TonB-dependent receptor plug domain-containing protein [Roseivirga echinicomitans]